MSARCPVETCRYVGTLASCVVDVEAPLCPSWVRYEQGCAYVTEAVELVKRAAS